MSRHETTVTRDGKHWVMKMEQWLPRPVDEIFPFFSDARNLERITPDKVHFEIVTPMPIDIKPGALIDYKLKIHGFPIRWRTEIAEWDPPRQFVDTQLRGPYALWHHTHTFAPQERDGVMGTLCEDVVKYRPKGWLLAGVVNALFVQKDVEQIFVYRAERLDEIFSHAPARPQAANASPEFVPAGATA